MKSLSRYAKLPTEQPNPKSRGLDRLPVAELVALMNREDAKIASSISQVRRDIVKAVDLIAPSLRRGGRLFFVGAGTSGRLCVMEAAECPPTFNTPRGLVQSVMAGGASSVFRSREGAEDRALEAEKAVRQKVKPGDVVVGVAASGVTPFALSALTAARKRKAGTILVTCNPQSSLKALADVVIAPKTGPEILTGSTRLKAGTATKMILNMLTTLSMVRLGKVWGHWMVDLQPRSRKLTARGLRLVQALGGATEEEAMDCFKRAGGRVKVAILMARRKLSPSAARNLLDRHDGFLGKALSD
ncbi:MAG: N-acetylmuramic acid 6-phosphate etherase [Elusimicrobia bacterium]|nr:N-acetylmuramic acid 6-phosphate etherase [Elusimicrobiota bacterium]